MGTSTDYLTSWPPERFVHNATGSVIINYFGCLTLDWASENLRQWWIQNVGIKWVSQYGIDGWRLDLEPGIASTPLWSNLRDQIEQATGKQIVLIPEITFSNRGYTFNMGQWDVGLGTPVDFYNPPAANIVDTVKNSPELFYSSGLSCHDSIDYAAKGRISAFGYGLLLSPYIPRWFVGEEFNATRDVAYYGTSASIPLYFSQIHMNEQQQNIGFYNQVKQLIQIRKNYFGIFSLNGQPLNTANITNVVTYSGVDLQPYTMWNNTHSLTVIASRNSTSGPVTITIPINQVNPFGYTSFHATELISGSTSLIFANQTNMMFHINQGGLILLLFKEPLDHMQPQDTLSQQTPSLHLQVPHQVQALVVPALSLHQIPSFQITVLQTLLYQVQPLFLVASLYMLF